MGAFGKFKKYTADAPEVVALGLGAIGAQMAWGYASPLVPVALSSLHPAVTPALELAAGVALFGLGAGSRNKWLKWAAYGMASGFSAGGVMGLANAFGVLPAAPAAAAAAGAQGGYLSGAVVDVQEVAGFAGAPVNVEDVSGFANVGATIY